MLSLYLLTFSTLFQCKPFISLSIPLSLFLFLSHFCAIYSHCKYKLQWFSFVFPCKVQHSHKFESCHICLLAEYKISLLHFFIFLIKLLRNKICDEFYHFLNIFILGNLFNYIITALTCTFSQLLVRKIMIRRLHKHIT